MNSSVEGEECGGSTEIAGVVPPGLWVALALSALTTIAAFCFNAFSVAALVRSKKLLNKLFTILLLNLALVDLLYCLCNISDDIIGYFCWGNSQCVIGRKGICFLYNTNLVLKGMDWVIIMIIGIERYISVCQTAKYSKIFSFYKVLTFILPIFIRNATVINMDIP